MEKFRELRATMDLDDRNYCVPIALALVTGVPATAINNSLIAQGRRVKGRGVHDAYWQDELKQMKFDCVNLTKTYLPDGRVSVKRIVDRLPKQGKFLVETMDHLLAVIDGVVEDWTAERLHKALRVYEIVPNGGAITQHTPKIVKNASRDKTVLIAFRDRVRPLVNAEDVRWCETFCSKVTGSWVKFYQDGGVAFLVGEIKGGKLKLALQEDYNSSRSNLEDAVALAVGPGKSSKSYVHWILDEAQFLTAVKAIRQA